MPTALDDWTGELSVFDGFYSTKPAAVISGRFDEIVAPLAPPDGPAVIQEKASGRFVVPCRLKSAPLIGKTRERAERAGLPLTGKQRSANHVTIASMVIADVDGVTGSEFKDICRSLYAAGISFLAYSSYSFGNPAKRGVHCRIMVPVDRALDASEYRAAAAGLNAAFLRGKADPSGFAMHQQQGVWTTSPDWKDRAFRLVCKRCVAEASHLIKAAATRAPQPRHSSGHQKIGDAVDLSRAAAALRWIDPTSYSDWIRTGYQLKAGFSDDGYRPWTEWADTAGDAITSGNVGEYDPETVWRRLDPQMDEEAGRGALYAAARDRAYSVVHQASQSDRWDERATDALAYLYQHHRTFYRTYIQEMLGE